MITKMMVNLRTEKRQTLPQLYIEHSSLLNFMLLAEVKVNNGKSDHYLI